MAPNKGRQVTSRSQLPARRPWRSGSVRWLGPRKVRVGFRIDGKPYSRNVEVRLKREGGTGDANAALADFRAEVEERLAAEGSKPKGVRTLRDVCNAYLELLENPRTVESYSHVLKRIPASLMDTDATKVETHDLDVMFKKMRTKYKAATRKHTLAVLNAILEHARVTGWIPTNPAKDVRRKDLNGDHEPERRELTAADVATLARAAEAKRDPVLAMTILLGSVTGLRRGELCGLKWGDLDPETGELSVVRQWVPEQGGQKLAPPKSRTGTRTVHLGPGSLALVASYRSRIAAIVDDEPSGWLLSYDGGRTPLRAKTVTEAITNLAKANKLSGITMHSVRRFHESEIIAEGIDPAAAAARLGHTPEVMWASYVKARKDRKVAAGAAVDARLASQGLTPAELLEGS